MRQSNISKNQHSNEYEVIYALIPAYLRLCMRKSNYFTPGMQVKPCLIILDVKLI